MKWQNVAIVTCLIEASLLIGGMSSKALAQSHSYINYSRSSVNSHLYFEQTVEGEFGNYTLKGSDNPETNGKEKWQGFGIGTSFGIEFMKFIQFTAGHTFVNLKSQTSQYQSLGGSRLNAGIKLVFLAPVANLELAGGALGSKLEYRSSEDHGTYYGSGIWYGIGANHFMSSRFSLLAQYKLVEEHNVKSGGSSTTKSIDVDSTQVAIGFRIWM